MNKKNILPHQGKPVLRSTNGKLPSHLAELSEEALGGAGVDPSMCFPCYPSYDAGVDASMCAPCYPSYDAGVDASMCFPCYPSYDAGVDASMCAPCYPSYDAGVE
ncbi:MAG: microcyclamide/patellamide family RiPP [Oscillatoriales cyanobacterium]|nr:MAG: microcyclamide/patellamide family RiPP [Oscillatoriales cyanobacterium]